MLNRKLLHRYHDISLNSFFCMAYYLIELS